MRSQQILELLMLFIIGGCGGAMLNHYNWMMDNFRADYPCPSTGLLYDPCPGWSANLVFVGLYGNLEWQAKIQD